MKHISHFVRRVLAKISGAKRTAPPYAKVLPRSGPHFDITDDGEIIALHSWRRLEGVIRDRLQLAGVLVPLETIAGWTNDQCKLADCWSISAYYSSIGNGYIKIPPKPDFLP